jgi:putative ATPase
MDSLFPDDVPTGAAAPAPLAERMRPRTFDEFIGQEELLAPGKPLREAIERDLLQSIILWGPPGTGKTTLARIVADTTKARFVSFSAVLAGIKEIRDVMAEAERLRRSTGRRTIVFIDEIHRFNKSQQDAFLPRVEAGDIVLIGATTENPSFEVNNALLSRAQVYVLHVLSAEELAQLFERAQQVALPELAFTDDARERIIGYADGDARRLLNALEQLQTAAKTAGVSKIDSAFLDNTLAQNLRRFDKGGEAFYDQISALHKSVRGSNPDAALYWFTRMLDGGADPLYLARRIVRMAWEDIGLADPRAIQLTQDAAQTYERLGSPEGELALAQAILYLACAPKSNAGYVAYNAARAWVAQDGSREVPLHLRNAPTKLMKQLDYGKGYRYAHNEADGYAAGENYFPDDMPPASFYQPTDHGLEAKIAEKLAHLRELDAAAKKKM